MYDISIMIKENYSLFHNNTFGIDAKCSYFIEYGTIEELKGALAFAKEKGLKMLHIGGGSNLLFTQDFNGVVLHAISKGIKIIEDTEHEVYVQADAGVVWDDFVDWTISHELYGLENLSLIPGEVGASAVQNIGAYGIEACQYIAQVNTLEIATRKTKIFDVKECDYGYRHSIFKSTLSGQYIITSVVYKLSKKFIPHLEYGALKSLLTQHKLSEQEVSARQLRDLIINVRNEKLPNPKEIGSAGSFFMNPVVTQETYERLAESYPNIPHYPVPGGIKLSAGWMIDQAGWKGKRIGSAGVYEKQALVLVNHGGAYGAEIVALAKKIQEDIYQQFGVKIYPEAIYI